MDNTESFGARVGHCALWEKVKEGHVHLITNEDVWPAFVADPPDLAS